MDDAAISRQVSEVPDCACISVASKKGAAREPGLYGVYLTWFVWGGYGVGSL